VAGNGLAASTGAAIALGAALASPTPHTRGDTDMIKVQRKATARLNIMGIGHWQPHRSRWHRLMRLLLAL